MNKKRVVIVAVLVMCLVMSMIPMTANAKNTSKNGVYIMLDAGHYAHYNKGAHPDYWESKQMWKLTEYLAEELEEYPGFVVGKTRKSQEKDLALADRGGKAKGYDLFISMHSNSSGSKSTTYPLVIVPAGESMKNYSLPIAHKLGATVKETMGINSNYAIWTKKQSDGRDWYGVIRGAVGVGTPGIILEHSFHSNYNVAKWLLSESNLRELASKEAAALAEHYGLSKSGEFKAPQKPEDFKAAAASGDTINISWKQSVWATGYEIFRADSEDGDYTKVGSVDDRSTSTFKDTGLEFEKTYYYKIRGYRNINGEVKYGEYSDIEAAKTKLAPPSEFDAVGYSYDTNKVTWKAIKGVQGYQIFRADSKSGDYELIETVSSKTSSYLDKGLETGKNYYYKVRTIKKIGAEIKASPYTSANGAKPIPAKPGISLSSSVDKIRIKWAPVEGADGYRIYRGTSASGKHPFIMDVQNTALDFLDTDLSSGKLYSYKVRAYKNVNGEKIMGNCCAAVTKYTR